MGIALLAGLLAVLVLLFVDDRFYVRNTEIHGRRFSSEQEIQQLAGVDAYSVFWINGRQVAERLVGLPFVKSARVRPLLPDRVRIDLVEREPEVLWSVNGQRFWADAEGYLLPVAGQLEGLPVLNDGDGSSVTKDGRVPESLVSGVLEMRSYLPGVTQLSYDATRGLHFTADSGTVVVLGRPAGLAERVSHLVALQADLARQGLVASEINLRHEGGYFYRLAR